MSSRKDRRVFRRYKHSSAFSLRISDHSYEAVTTDYSLKGIGFSIDSAPNITVGSPVRFSIDDMKIDDEGRIVWAENVNSRIKGGIERKTVSGLLGHYPLADMLLDIRDSRKDGLLDLRHNKIAKRIYFLTGDIVYATSNTEEDRFIEVLLRIGMITSDQYYQAVNAAKKTRKTPGEVLVDLGYLTPEDLLTGIRRQVEEIVSSLFLFEDAHFVFIEDVRLSDETVRLNLSASNLIYHGIRRIRSIAYLRRVLPPFDIVMSRLSNADITLQDLHIEETDRTIFKLVDGKRSVKDILDESPAGELGTL
ncbi:MAG: DUF4388 domain-containing protein, partial [Nitrospirota bacterium]